MSHQSRPRAAVGTFPWLTRTVAEVWAETRAKRKARWADDLLRKIAAEEAAAKLQSVHDNPGNLSNRDNTIPANSHAGIPAGSQRIVSGDPCSNLLHPLDICREA
jgi:hypothetical protein